MYCLTVNFIKERDLHIIGRVCVSEREGEHMREEKELEREREKYRKKNNLYTDNKLSSKIEDRRQKKEEEERQEVEERREKRKKEKRRKKREGTETEREWKEGESEKGDLWMRVE
jgi:hypothetical protein